MEAEEERKGKKSKSRTLKDKVRKKKIATLVYPRQKRSTPEKQSRIDFLLSRAGFIVQNRYRGSLREKIRVGGGCKSLGDSRWVRRLFLEGIVS